VTHLRAINPADYYFITSLALSPGQKDQLRAVFDPWMADADHVFGGDDLDGLLTRHEVVERRHPKLWLASGSQLFWATHSELANRAIALRDRIASALPRYVVNRGYAAARELLDNHRVCLIAGVPGIGKTILAQVLLADAMTLGYEPVDVSADIDEAWTALNGTQLQVFLYDDFLGQLSFSERLGKNEDRRLTEFIAKVASTKSKLLILTTREYILQDARRSYELLTAMDERMHFVLKLEDYTRGDRARILYNHLWHGELSDKALAEVARGGYRRIVDHQNYSPRLIEFCTGPAFDRTSSGYVARFAATLDHPTRLWRNAFEAHLLPDQQLLAITLSTLPPYVGVRELETAHAALCRRRSVPMTGAKFRTGLDVMEGTFIAIERVEGEPTVRFHNPSVREFLLDWLADDSGLVADVVAGAEFFEQLQRLHLYGVGGEGWGRKSGRPDLIAALQGQAAMFTEALMTKADGPSPFLLRESDRREGRRPSGWFEDRVAFVLSLKPPVRPPREWITDQLRTLMGRWEHGQGGKASAVRLVHQLTDEDEIDQSLIEEIMDVLERWLADDLGETEEDWLPYLTYLEDERGVLLYEDMSLSRRFSEYVRSEIRRWSPSPPNLEELLDYANKFALPDTVREIEEKIEEDRRRDEEESEQRPTKPRSKVERQPSADDTDIELNALFARLVSPEVPRQQ